MWIGNKILLESARDAMEKTITSENRDFWEGLYQKQTTPWDLGKAAPPLVTFLKSPYAVPPGRILIVGCGRGHEALLFAQNGFEVTGVDFAPSAVQATSKRLADGGFLGTNAYMLERNFFDIHEYDGYYDYILEHCTFCAIDPSMRRTYSWTVRDLLRPGGKLIGLWWLLPEKKGGPPFSVHKTEIFEFFREDFCIDIAYQPQDSVPERKGQELLTVLTKLG